MSTENQDQRPGESVGSLDQIAELLLGSSSDDGASSDQLAQDELGDASLTDTSTDSEVEEGQEESNEEAPTWASALGVSDDDVVLDEEGNFKGVKVGDGETVSLADLKNGFQFNKANTQKAQALAEERRHFDEQRTQVATEYVKRLENANKLTEKLTEKYLEEFNAIDWNRLRIERPGDYAALQRDFDVRKSELQTIFSALDGEQEKLSAQAQQEQQEAFNRHLAKQAEIAVANNPAWKDVNKFKSDMSDMTKFVNEAYGFTEQEFMSVYDARLLSLISDAMKYRNGTKQLKEIEQTTSKVAPKFQKSSGPAKKTTKLDQLVKTAKSAKGYQKRTAETDAIAALLLQG